jgi:hypothetical protein
VFTTSKRIDAFMDTTYLDCVMRCLERMDMYPTDKNIVHLVKIQMLAQSVVRTLSVSLLTRESPQFSFVPLIMVVKNFQGQIEEYKNSLPQELKNNGMLLIEYSRVGSLVLTFHQSAHTGPYPCY